MGEELRYFRKAVSKNMMTCQFKDFFRNTECTPKMESAVESMGPW